MHPNQKKFPAHTLTVSTALFAALALPSFVTTATASASLAKVGPALSSSPSKAKDQIELLVQHDVDVRVFIGRQTYLPATVFAHAEVVSVEKKSCIVGASTTCGMNSGKEPSGTLRTTDFRKGTRVDAYVATIEYDKGKTVKVTFLKPCSNILGLVKVKHTNQIVSIRQPIPVRVDASSSAVCAGGTASASVSVTTTVKSWSAFAKAIASASATCAPAPVAPAPVNVCVQKGLVESSPGSGVCQANSASSSQDSKTETTVDNDCKEPNNSCNTTINNTTIQNTTIIQINANCSKVVVTYGDGAQTVQYKDTGGNVVNEEYCTVKTENPPPTTPAPVDHAPQITITGSPAHVYVGGNVYGFIEAYDPDGDMLTVTAVASANAHVAGLVPSDNGYDGQPCRATVSCYRFTLWGDSVGTTTVTTTVYAGGKSNSASAAGIPVKKDEF